MLQVEGATRTSRRTGEVQRFQGGQWVTVTPGNPQAQAGGVQVLGPQAPPPPPPPPPPSGFYPTGPTSVAPLTGGPQDPNRPAGPNDITESERKNSFNAGRIATATRSLEQAIRQDPSAARPTATATAAGVLGSEARNYANSAARQQIETAQREIVDAALTLGTGASYQPEQLDTQVEYYFPRLTDDPQTVAAKRVRLRGLLELSRQSAGRAAPQIDEALRVFDQALFMEDAGQLTNVVNQAARAPDPLNTQVDPMAPTGAPPASPPGPSRPAGTPTFWDDPTPPAGDQPPEDFVQFREQLQAAFNTRRLRTVEEVMAYANRINPEYSRLINPQDVARALEAQRRNPNASVDAYTPTRRPDVSDARGGQPTVQLNGELGLGPLSVSGSINSEQIDAFGRGAADIATVGGADYLAAVGDTLTGDGTFGENLWRQREIDNFDEERHPISRFAGQATGALALPTGVASAGRTAAVQALRGGATREAAIQAARTAVARRMAVEGGSFSGLYGFNSSEGDFSQGAAEGIVSALIGAGTGYGLGAAGSRLLGPRINRAPRGDPDQLAAAQAADELGIDLPGFVAGGPSAQQAGARAEQTAFGGPVIREARNTLLDQSEVARNRIAGDVGNAVEPTEMGEVGSRAAGAYRRSSGREGGRLYDAARAAAGDTPIAPQNTMQTLAQLIRADAQVPLPTKIRPILNDLASNFENGGPITIEGARAMRSELRNLLRETTTPGDAERITRQIMNAVNQDIEAGLRAAGREAAIPAYRRADEFWRRRLDTIHRVMDRYTGKDGNNFGEDVARAIISDTRGGGTRLGRFLRTIPPEQAQTVRASLIRQLGRSSSGQQDAAGEGFSLETFLTNWDQIRGARERIFDPATVRSLNNLAMVAARARQAGRERNFSNTGRIFSAIFSSSPLTAGGGASLATGDLTGAAVGASVSGLIALRQYINARTLASPAFARRLAATPADDARAQAYWSQPWVTKLARSEPAIANDLLGIQRAIAQALGSPAVTRAAASPDAERDRQQ